MNPCAVPAEAPRPRAVVKEIHLRLRLDAQPEHLPLLHHRLVQKVVPDAARPARRRPLSPPHTGNVIQVRMGQQDVPDRQLVRRGGRQELVDLVPRVDKDPLAGVFTPEHEAVLEEGLDRASLENHG